MARLRSSQLPPETSGPSQQPNGDDETGEGLEAASDAETPFSTANRDLEQQVEKDDSVEEDDLNRPVSKNPMSESTKTPRGGILERVSSWFGKSQSNNSADQNRPDNDEGGRTAINVDEPNRLTSSRIDFGVHTDQADEEVEEFVDAIAPAEEEQHQVQKAVGATPEHKIARQEGTIVNGSKMNSIPSQPIEERPASTELPRPSISRLTKSKKPKPAVHNDGSFHFSKPPKRDVYDMPDSEEEDAPQKNTKTEKNGQGSKKNNDKTKKESGNATKGDNETLEVEDSPRRRGRPPKSSQNAKVANNSVETVELPVKKSAASNEPQKASQLTSENPDISPGQKRKRGRPKGTHNEENQSTQVNDIQRRKVSDNGHESDHQDPPQNGDRSSTRTSAALRKKTKPKQTITSKEQPSSVETETASGVTENYTERSIENGVSQDAQDEPTNSPVTNKPTIPKGSKKRTNAHLETSSNKKITSRPSKRAKTTDTTQDSNEEGEDNNPEPSNRNRISRERTSRSESSAAPQKTTINLVREVANAEQLARQRIQEVQTKKRELKKAERSAEQAEMVAERWRNRLAAARAEAIAKDREAKGLPPLEKERRVHDLDDEADDEDLENGVERVGGVFGHNNLSNVTSSVPFSDEEKKQLIHGLFDHRNDGQGRFYEIYKFPIFRANNRNFDELLAKIVEFKADMLFDWEKRRVVDVGIKPLDRWILSIPDTVEG